MTPDKPDKPSTKGSFLLSLDTVRQTQAPTQAEMDKVREHEIKRVAFILKATGLFSKQLLLSDTQLIDNYGIRHLWLNDSDFRDFAQSKLQGEPTLVAGVRRGVISQRLFDVFQSQFNRERPMLLSSLSTDLYKRSKTKRLPWINSWQKATSSTAFPLFSNR